AEPARSREARVRDGCGGVRDGASKAPPERKRDSTRWPPRRTPADESEEGPGTGTRRSARSAPSEWVRLPLGSLVPGPGSPGPDPDTREILDASWNPPPSLPSTESPGAMAR